MKNYSISKQLIKNSENFLSINYYSLLKKLFNHKGAFYGWGKKKSGQKAVELAKKYNTSFVLLEDGFIRSIGLGVESAPSFSLVEDNIGIYYDATKYSKLENILNSYNFNDDKELLKKASLAIKLIKQHNISKYNSAPLIDNIFIKRYKLNSNKTKVLIVAQTAGDSSLNYGLANKFTTSQIINEAKNDNPNSQIYIKIHPDVLSGKKRSDIVKNDIPKDCIIIDKDINPISLLKYFDKVYTKTSGMGMEALILNKEVHTFGMPFYARWGLTIDKLECKRRKRELSTKELFAGAYILYTKYFNPYKNKKSDIIDTIETIVKYKEVVSYRQKFFFLGFSRWKRDYIKLYFNSSKKSEIYFCNSLNEIKRIGIDRDDKIYIWGNKNYKELKKYIFKNNISTYRVEDGFIRSVSLGLNFTMPYSLTIDKRGVYYDSSKESNLEYILQNYTFSKEYLKRAKYIKEFLTKNKISKYNIYKDLKLNYNLNQNIILVVGQVQGDASLIYGANSMKNIELLKKVKENNPNSYIIYKPHPDVLSGKRDGGIKDTHILQFANKIETKVSIDSLLSVVKEVHTMTSLVGLEALIRNKKVVCYGMPFYAGWGLTTDLQKCKRRTRKLSLLELIAATYIIYPYYFNSKEKRFCEVEDVLELIKIEKNRYNNSIVKFFKLLKSSIIQKYFALFRYLDRLKGDNEISN